jgi:hypothetical protein
MVSAFSLLLDLDGKDTDLMWKYRRGELDCSEEQWDELCGRFRQAEVTGYKEFLKVANPGYIVQFGFPDPDFKNFLSGSLKVDPARIEKKELLFDGTDEIGESYIINNH